MCLVAHTVLEFKALCHAREGKLSSMSCSIVTNEPTNSDYVWSNALWNLTFSLSSYRFSLGKFLIPHALTIISLRWTFKCWNSRYYLKIKRKFAWNIKSFRIFIHWRQNTRTSQVVEKEKWFHSLDALIYTSFS